MSRTVFAGMWKSSQYKIQRKCAMYRDDNRVYV